MMSCNYLALVWACLCCHTLVRASVVTHTRFKRYVNMQFTKTTSTDVCATSSSCDGTLLVCAVYCSRDPTCVSMNYAPDTKMCMKNAGNVYTFGDLSLTSSSSVHFVSKVEADITDGDWVLAFRGQSGNGVSIKETWLKNGFVSDLANMDLAWPTKTNNTSVPHYRSRWIDLWPSDDISEVKFEMYASNDTVVRMIFDGSGSTNTDWFSVSTLISTTYTDFLYSPPTFSLTGKFFRSFYVTNSPYFECSHLGWIIVQDNFESTCSWTDSTIVPRFMYSTGNTFSNFASGDYNEADVLAVFIKFK